MNAHETCPKARHAVELAELERIVISENRGEVLLPVAQAQVIRTYREGDDLLIEVADGRVLRVEGYFADESADAIALYTSEGPDGETALLEIGGEAQPASLGRLDEMFAADDNSFEEALENDEVLAQRVGRSNTNDELVTAMLVGGTLVTAAAVLTWGGDGDKSSDVGTQAQALARIKGNPTGAGVREWEHFGVDVAGLSEEDQAAMLANLAVPLSALTPEELADLGASELRWIADMVQRAAPDGQGEIVTAMFGSLDLEVDTDGDGTADKSADFETEDNYRPTSGEFYDGTVDGGNGTVDERQQYYYYGENTRAARTDVDGHGTGDNANGTIERVERDTDGDGTVDSWAESDNEDGTIDRIVTEDTAAFAKIDAGTVTWDDFRAAGIDVEQLASSESTLDLQQVRDVMAIAKSANGNEALNPLQVQGIVSVLHYAIATRNADLHLDTATGRVVTVDLDSPPDEEPLYRYDEWDLSLLSNNWIDFDVQADGTSDTAPDTVDPEIAFRLDFARILGWGEISVTVDFGANLTYDVEYLGVFDESKGDGGDYVLVAAEFLSGGEYNSQNVPADRNLNEIMGIGRLESITLDDSATTLVLDTDFLLGLASNADDGIDDGTSEISFIIEGGANGTVDFESSIGTSDDLVVNGNTYNVYQATGTVEDTEITVSVLVDPDITVDTA